MTDGPISEADGNIAPKWLYYDEDEVSTTAVRNAMGWWVVAIAIGTIAGLGYVALFGR
jgi:hypothetical protein